MKKTLTFSALALSVAVLGAAAVQTQATAGPRYDGPAVQEAQWRGDEDGGWRKGRHGRHDGSGHEGRHGGRRDGGRDGDGRRAGRAMDQLQEFDIDKDGSITQAEVDQFRQNQITEFDANKDGTLSLEEYQALWLSVMRERMVDAFQEHDDDGNSQVTAEEFNERFTGLVERLDRNGDGKLNEDDHGGRRQKNRAAPAESENNTAPEPAPAPAPAPEPVPAPQP